ncbi:hypothetical protein D4R30_00895 [archaeon]|nr:MAG: hypothetical protein D4R30_00895 [archaeon]
MPQQAHKCALCKRRLDSTPVVCVTCHDRAVEAFGKMIRELHGQVMTERSANAIMSLFAKCAHEAQHAKEQAAVRQA